MTLVEVNAAHLRVTCDGCGTNTAEVCGKRDLPTMARVAAVRKFQAVGWHFDPSRRAASTRGQKEASEMGDGKWYCPDCARRTHL